LIGASFAQDDKVLRTRWEFAAEEFSGDEFLRVHLKISIRGVFKITGGESGIRTLPPIENT
jgi:hypothetical protein